MVGTRRFSEMKTITNPFITETTRTATITCII